MADAKTNKSDDANKSNAAGNNNTGADSADVVLVPPAGVHTPGDTAAKAATGTPLVAAPRDAFSNPDAATQAYQDAQSGNYAKVSGADIAHQNADGSAMTPDEHGKAEKADEKQESVYGDPTAKPDGITK